VAKLVVCNPRKNALLKSGSKSDAIDERKLAELLRAGMLSPVYHGETSALEVQQMARSYSQLTEDTTRVMARLKAVFRGQAVSCVGKKLYGKRHREEYLAQLDGGLRRRAEHLYQELDALQPLRHAVRRELMGECRKHAAAQWLQSVPFLGPIRAALLIGRVQTPHRFRTKRQFWSYCGLALETRDSGEYRVVNGQTPAGADSRTELEPQSRDEESVQERGHGGQRSAGGVARILSGAAGQRYAAGDGAPDAGPQDRRHHAEDLEERRKVQRRACEATSSLSAQSTSERGTLVLVARSGGR
jgi:hypothetical protein